MYKLEKQILDKINKSCDTWADLAFASIKEYNHLQSLDAFLYILKYYNIDEFSTEEVNYLIKNSNLKNYDSDGYNVLSLLMNFNNTVANSKLTPELWEYLTINSDPTPWNRPQKHKSAYTNPLFSYLTYRKAINLNKKTIDYLIDKCISNNKSISKINVSILLASRNHDDLLPQILDKIKIKDMKIIKKVINNQDLIKKIELVLERGRVASAIAETIDNKKKQYVSKQKI